MSVLLYSHAFGKELRYLKMDVDNKHRNNPWLTPKCPSYSCPTLQRPVQKSHAEYKPWAFREPPWELDHFAPAKDDEMEVLKDCVTVYQVCLGTCGISWKFCFDRYWECVE